MIEYAIIPISFENYDQFVTRLNEYGKEGWIFSSMIRTYENSPIYGVTTYDFVCYRKKRWWRKN